MNKKVKLFLLFIPAVLILSYLDLILIGRLTLKEYIFQSSWEYCLIWVGFYFGDKYSKKEIEK